ncbi:hypothetical protein PTKIN_Ptkin13bG0211900 [Pterospermum kingtungense]
MKCSKPSFSLAVFLTFSSLILSAYSQSESQDHEFNYDESSGRGPSRWGLLKPEWRNCSVGRQQSPINIGAVEVNSQLGDLQRNYTSAPSVLRNRTEDVALFGSIKTLGSRDKPLGPVNPENIGYPGRRYYRYMGSLTTPRCSEGVVWTVFEQVKTVSSLQAEALRDVLPPVCVYFLNSQNRNNARPTLALNGRTVRVTE